MDNPLKYFAELTDPRVERNREHLLEEILLIAIAAVLSGAESWNDIALCGEDKREWLETFLTLPGSALPEGPSTQQNTSRGCPFTLVTTRPQFAYSKSGSFICVGPDRRC